jgi:hypothetical protein
MEQLLLLCGGLSPPALCRFIPALSLRPLNPFLRELVYEFAEESTIKVDDQLTRPFSLSTYLEARVKAVVMDVSSIANAFVIFESMNARGNELSILNLVKNHVFGQAGSQNINQVHQDWNIMTKRIEDKNPDDFLKIFWTSRFGRVQKPQLYNRVKSEYSRQGGALTLAQDLALASEHYIALDDPQHDIWGNFGALCSQRMETLILLGSRQTRAPILSAIDHFDKENMESFLWSLILLTVRYQIVGQRRTGPLEIACARVANLIHMGQIRSNEDFWREINTIVPGDEEFLTDFLRFSDRKAKRVAYFLAQLELTARRKEGLETEDLQRIAHCPEDLSLDFVVPKKLGPEWNFLAQSDPEIVEQWLYRLGNRVLIDPEIESAGLTTFSFTQKVMEVYSRSRFLLTKHVTTDILKKGRAALENRQRILSDLAVATWPLPQHVRQRRDDRDVGSKTTWE